MDHAPRHSDDAATPAGRAEPEPLVLEIPSHLVAAAAPAPAPAAPRFDQGFLLLRPIPRTA